MQPQAKERTARSWRRQGRTLPWSHGRERGPAHTWTGGSGLPAGRQYISAVLRPLVCGHWLQQPQETNIRAHERTKRTDSVAEVGILLPVRVTLVMSQVHPCTPDTCGPKLSPSGRHKKQLTLLP